MYEGGRGEDSLNTFLSMITLLRHPRRWHTEIHNDLRSQIHHLVYS